MLKKTYQLSNGNNIQMGKELSRTIINTTVQKWEDTLVPN